MTKAVFWSFLLRTNLQVLKRNVVFCNLCNALYNNFSCIWNPIYNVFICSVIRHRRERFLEKLTARETQRIYSSPSAFYYNVTEMRTNPEYDIQAKHSIWILENKATHKYNKQHLNTSQHLRKVKLWKSITSQKLSLQNALHKGHQPERNAIYPQVFISRNMT